MAWNDSKWMMVQVKIVSNGRGQMSIKGMLPMVGSGPGMIGDPSGKNEMRQMMTPDTIDDNVNGIKQQLSRSIDFEHGAILANNADWLAELAYIPFLRDIGRHFSINRMIKAERYRQRIESEVGLSFIKFNCMLLQPYDFFKLFDKYDRRLQMGGHLYRCESEACEQLVYEYHSCGNRSCPIGEKDVLKNSLMFRLFSVKEATWKVMCLQGESSKYWQKIGQFGCDSKCQRTISDRSMSKTVLLDDDGRCERLNSPRKTSY